MTKLKINMVSQMMKVVGEEGTSLDDFQVFLKSDFLDNVYLQQNGFDEVDAATDAERQKYSFSKVAAVLEKEFTFLDKDKARQFFYEIRHMFIDWNYQKWGSEEFKQQEKGIDEALGR
ncbi:MAG: hypothetical protein KKG84_03370 [Candidatus Omnitrophica bacterium]|nr:hypothetical protein [Candidatus Omnitrophota bacterium]